MEKTAITAALFAGALTLASVSTTAYAAPAASPKEPVDIVTVEQGDTLEKIALANGTTYPRLFDANPQISHPDVIYAGAKVRVPAKSEKLAQRPLPGAAVQVQAYTASYAQPSAYEAHHNAARTITYKPVVSITSRTSGGVWDRLAACESSGNWSVNTGNGYYGGLQFTQSSWQAVGGTGLASQASKAEQIKRAERLLKLQGWGAWPACSAKLGLR